MRFTLKELATDTCGQWIGTPPDETQYCPGVTTDSRQVEPGHCFWALRGEHCDGHDYIEQVLKCGAACCVVDHNPDITGGPLLQVEDVTTALGQLAAALRERFTGTVVAVTGSVGKTTTRHMIAHVLGRHYRTHQSPKNFNNHLGLPLTILSAPDDTEMLVVELGSNAPGEIAALTRVARPHIAVTTNAYPAHLAGFGSIKAVRREKLSIAEGLVEDGTFIVGRDCPGLLEAVASHAPNPVTFGLESETDVQLGPESNTVMIEGTAVTVPLPGPGNVQNALAAWAVFRQLGGTIEDFAEDLSSLKAVDQRSEVIQCGSLTLLNDCYNANPMSMHNALATLAAMDPTGKRRRIFVCGDMGELGPQAEALHQELGRDIAHYGIDIVVATGPLSKRAARTARQESNNGIKISCYPDTDSACAGVAADIKDGDLILIKGSRAAGLERIVQQLIRQQPETKDQQPNNAISSS